MEGIPKRISPRDTSCEDLAPAPHCSPAAGACTAEATCGPTQRRETRPTAASPDTAPGARPAWMGPHLCDGPGAGDPPSYPHVARPGLCLANSENRVQCRGWTATRPLPEHAHFSRFAHTNIGQVWGQALVCPKSAMVSPIIWPASASHRSDFDGHRRRWQRVMRRSRHRLRRVPVALVSVQTRTL